MKAKYLSLILSLNLLAPQELDAQRGVSKKVNLNPLSWFSKDNSEGKKGLKNIKTKKAKNIKAKKQDTKLIPIEWYDNINPVSNAYSTATTSTSDVLIVRGDFYNNGLRAATGKSFKDTTSAYFDHVSSKKGINRIVNQFEATNLLEKGSLSNRLSQYILLPEQYASLFVDGNLNVEEFNKLPIGKYKVFIDWKSQNHNPKKKEGASLPLILLIEKTQNILYETKTKEVKQEVKEKTSLETKVDSSKKGFESEVCEVNDSTKADKTKSNLELYFAINRDISYELGVIPRFSRYFGLGIYGGFIPKDNQEVITPIINNFYGYGTKDIENYYIGVNAGIYFNERINLSIGGGAQIQKTSILEQIRKKNGQVVSQNTDDYVKVKPEGHLDLNYYFTKNLGIGAGFRYDTFNKEYAARGKINVKF